MTWLRFLVPAFCLLMLLASGCRSGKIPCPDIGTKKKLFSFGNGSGTKEAPLGQNVDFSKNGLIKKKNYKYLRNKPKRKKYK